MIVNNFFKTIAVIYFLIIVVVLRYDEFIGFKGVTIVIFLISLSIIGFFTIDFFKKNKDIKILNIKYLLIFFSFYFLVFFFFLKPIFPLVKFDLKGEILKYNGSLKYESFSKSGMIYLYSGEEKIGFICDIFSREYCYRYKITNDNVSVLCYSNLNAFFKSNDCLVLEVKINNDVIMSRSENIRFYRNEILCFWLFLIFVYGFSFLVGLCWIFYLNKSKKLTA